MKIIKKFKNIYFLPLILIFDLPLLIFAIQVGKGTKNYFAFIISIVLLMSIKILFKIKPFRFVLLLFPLLLLSLIYTIQVIEYSTFVNISTWSTVFDSYAGEFFEFLNGLSFTTFFLIIIQIIAYFFYLFITYKKSIYSNRVKNKYVIYAIFIFFVIDFFSKGATTNAFPVRSVNTLYMYYKAKKMESKYKKVKKNARFNVIRDKNYLSSEKETIVIVVGESLRKDHLQYYGYNRETTPLMKEENIITYTDVVAPANQTINSLKRVFTLAEYLDDDQYWKTPSLIRAFKEAGFKSYWITNQPVYGKYASEASFIAQESDEFITKKNSNLFFKSKHNNYDMDLIPIFQKILKNNFKKKIIFLHLLGNHATYMYRYPKEFNFFNKNSIDDTKKTLINEYDNAIRYNDLFLYKILESLKQVDGEKSFIMFSDHGESLFDTPNNCFHGSANPSQSEFNVPLILWFSEEFKKEHPQYVNQVVKNKDLPVLNSDFFHALPFLYGIDFKKLIKSNAFFSDYYKPKYKRKVVNVNLELLDYDKLTKPQINDDF